MQRTKACSAQLSYLAEYMRSHPSMASGLSQTLQGRANLEKSWVELATKLNSLGGPTKTVSKWKQAWRDLRNNVKKKASHNKKEFRGYGPGSTGNGPPTLQNLTAVEEQVLTVMGPVAVFGMENVVSTEPMIEIEIPQSSAHPEPQETNLPGPTTPPPPPLTPPPPPPPPPTPAAPPLRKRKRVVARHDSFDVRLLQIEEEKLKIKRERNTIAQEKNEILNRLVNVLADISNKKL